jgi:hypothetical protein
MPLREQETNPFQRAETSSDSGSKVLAEDEMRRRTQGGTHAKTESAQEDVAGLVPTGYQR